MSASQKVPVTISMYPEHLARLDQIAADLDRSRSWVATRALGAFLAVTDSSSPHLIGADGEAEPPGAGFRQPVPRLDHQQENALSEAFATPPPEHGQGDPRAVHLAHLARVNLAKKQQAGEAQAVNDRAMNSTAEYFKAMGASE